MNIGWEIENVIEDFTRQEVFFRIFGSRFELGYLEFGILLGLLSILTVTILNRRRAPLRARGIISGFFTTVITAPIIEEIIFRFVLITVLTVVFNSVVLAVLGSAFLFALGHMLYGNLRFVDSFISGLLWGWAFTLVGLPVTIIAHMTHNFIAWGLG